MDFLYHIKKTQVKNIPLLLGHCIYIIIIYIYIYMYVYTICRLQNHKDKMFCPYGFGHVFCPSRFFFQIQPCPAANPLLYRSIVFLKSWICRTGSDSMSVSSRDSIWGSMLTSAYCFFSTWCWKNTSVLWVHPNLMRNMAVFVARFGYWITTPNLLHFGLIPLLETVGGCPNPVLSKDLNNPSQSKTKIITQLNKKTSVTGKTHNGPKKLSIRLSRYK